MRPSIRRDDEVNTVVDKVKTWSHKVEKHHGHENIPKRQNGYKPNRDRRGTGGKGH